MAPQGRVKYYNLWLDVHDYASALKTLESFYLAEGCKKVFFINAHCFNVAQRNKDYYRALLHADLVLNDGIGIEIGARLAGIRLLTNMNGTDFTPEVIKQAAQLGKKIFLLGSKPGVTRKTIKVLEQKVPGVIICGHYHGFFKEEENEKLIDKINRSGAELLLVGMGVPRQELWIESHYKSLTTVKIAMAVGAAFDFISGTIPRAPLWMRKIKMEWFYRFLIEPKRMFGRYITGNVKFFINLLLSSKKDMK